MGASGVSVRLFEALLNDTTRVILKEFVGDTEEARGIGETEQFAYELLTMNSMMMNPSMKAPEQVATLLGRMQPDSTFSSATFRAEWIMAMPDTPPPGTKGFWLVFLFEGLRPISSFPSQRQKGRSFMPVGVRRQAWSKRRNFLKSVCKETLETIGWLHGQGIVHRSLGPSSLLLSTYDQSESPRVQCIDFGFAVTASRLSEREVASAIGRGAEGLADVIPFLMRADDLHALGYVFLELLLGASSSGVIGGPRSGPSTDIPSIKNLVEDVCEGDVRGRFRNYCYQIPEWRDAVEMLDEADLAGWDLIQAFVACGLKPSEEAVKPITAQFLLLSPWFDFVT